MYDVAIIGAGVVGCAIARELSRYKVKACVIEKCEDVCCGTSKANSAIIHAGYDAACGSVKAELNVIGNAMMDELSRDLDFPFRRNGSLVVMYKGDDRKKLDELLERGRKNNVPGLVIYEGEELKELEENLSEDAVAALYAPTAGIVCPFNMTIAYAENAAENGIEFFLNTEVTSVRKEADCYVIESLHKPSFKEPDKVTFKAKAVVNAAGVYSDIIHNMVSERKYNITPRRGCYFLLDRTSGDFLTHTVFSLPSKMGKGILSAPTIHGNLIVGPDAYDTDDREGTNTLGVELDKVRESALHNLNNPPLKTVITSFAGLRAHEDSGEFIIGECSDSPLFFDCVGVESPGLSASPAIGARIAGMVAEKLDLRPNKDFNPKRQGILNPNRLTAEERNALIKEKPEYGNIVCRCESISEGEIVDAIKRPLGARSLDAVKRRTRAGMGRCQSGFCSPRTMEILARELKCSIKDITKSGGASYLIPHEDINEKYRQADK